MTPPKPNCIRLLARTLWTQTITSAAVIALGTLQGHSQTVEPKPRFEIKGTAVYLDMDGEYVGLSRRGDEEVPDHNVLADIVFENPDIDTVFLTGQGGWSYSAVLMNRNIQWAGLNTVAYKECLSACAVVFIGGAERTLAKGGILGFHRAGTHVGELEEYYTSVRAEKGWTNEFQFAEWNFEAGQIHARDMLALIVENGISPMLAVNMLSVDKDDIWRPTEDELMELRVITDGQTETEDFSDVP